MYLITSITNGRQRHTFALTTWKTCMASKPDVPFTNEEIEDIIRRIYSTNQTELQDKQAQDFIDTISKSIMPAQEHEPFVGHRNSGWTILGAATLLRNPKRGSQMASWATCVFIDLNLIRHITLIHSDTLAEPI